MSLCITKINVVIFLLVSDSANVSISGGGEIEEGDDDAEYNYLADQEEVEKEEFRNDRAVKISSKIILHCNDIPVFLLVHAYILHCISCTEKEVDDLLSELLNPVCATFVD